MYEQHKKIYQHSGKCDDQQNIKDMIDSDMVSTPEGFTDNSHSVPMTSTPVKKQVLENHCVYSLTYWMLNQKKQNVVFWLQNKNTEP